MSSCGSCHHVGHNLAALIGRILIALLFLVAAGMKIDNWDATVQMISDVGLAWPAALAAVAVALEIIGGLCVFFGFRTRFGSLLLILVVIAATLLFADFWNLAQEQRELAEENFARNLFYLGALLLLTGFGPGRYSIDECCCRNKGEGKEGGCCKPQ